MRISSFRLELAPALLLAFALALAAAGRAEAQLGFVVSPRAEALFPALGSQGDYTTGYAGLMVLDLTGLPYLVPFVRAGYGVAPYKASGELRLGEADLGLALALRPSDRSVLRLDAMGGLTNVSSPVASGSAYAAGLRLGLGYRITPALSISASTGLSSYFGTKSSFYSAAVLGLAFSFDLSKGSASRLRIEGVKIDPVFPSLYSYYDDHPFGEITLVNGEDAELRDVRVSFNAGHYMDQPKLCALLPAIAKGGSVRVPVRALFTEALLSLTQGTDAKGEIVVDYVYVGSRRQTRLPVDFRLHHRNAITWLDDRRAASFVSPMNPAVLWFSKFVAGVVRDRLRGDVNRNLQYAVGLFEAERLYGLNYVVVPSNDYSVHHDDKTYIDSVSFPHQTFFYRGGDCSDLAILYSALLESVGIEAAFITIPGHIFAAFSLGISEAEAKAEFYDPGMLIYRDGRAWAPVEITMVKDGFTKAWRVGAKEWYDNVRLGTAAFYPVREAWKSYPPAAFPDVNPRFSLPDEVLTMQSFDLSLDRYVAREIEPRIKETRARLAAGDPRIMANELGILYGRYGMLKESWAQFSAAAKGDFQSAWTNLGNVAYLRKDYKLAVGYYQWALKLDSEDHNALLGIARSQYELELFDESDRAYAELLAKDPELARRNGYLASIYGGEGRAWSLSDRFAGTAWAVPRERPAMALAPASVASPAPAAPAPPAPPSVVASEPVPGTALQGETMAKAQEEARPEGAVPAIGELPGPDAQVSPPPPLVLARPSPAKDAAEAAPQIAEALPEDADILAKLAASNAAKQEAEKAILAASVGPSPQAPPPVASPAESEDPIIVAVAPQPEAPAAQVEASAPQLEAPAAQVEASAPQLEAPAAQVEAPAAQVEAPAAQVEAPAAQLEGPAAQVEAPAAQVKAPAAQVEAPAAQLEAPAAQVEAPAAQVKAPAAQVEAPAAQVEAPAPQLEAPAPQPEAPAVQLEAQAPPAETSLPPVLTTATESYASLAEGFGSSFIGSGRWTVDPSTARQTDPDQFRAKLVLPLAQGQGSFRYSFSARSMGKGWVGLGLHIYAAGSKTHSGYGSGESILVWLTRDPVHFAKDTTRIQVYRSTTDVRMSLVAESPVELSIFELNRIEVEFDSNAGGVSVRVNGKEGLSTKLRGPIAEGAYVILRCIDKAEFADFRVESKR